MELLNKFPISPLGLIVLAVLAYLGRNWFEGALKKQFSISEGRIAASLALKTGLRSHEQDELVDFRVAIEKWEYFLQCGIGDLAMQSESDDFSIANFSKTDQELFGAVRVSAVRASIFLRNADLENELLQTITAIRRLYYPIVQAAMASIVDLQGRMFPYLNRIRLYEASGQKDAAIMLTAEEAQIFVGLRHQMTGALADFSKNLIDQYKPIAEQLYVLKSKINVYIYRPLKGHEVDGRDG